MNSKRNKEDNREPGTKLGRSTEPDARPVEEQVLVELRRIIRAAQMSAKQLAREAGMTTSQLVVLDLLRSQGRMTPGQIARTMNLTQATITILLDRLQALGLVQRQRGEPDRRTVQVHLTAEGRKRLEHAPQSLQQRFVEGFAHLQPWEKTAILSALQRLSQLMAADALDAAPLLEVGAISRSADAADGEI